MTGLSPFFSNFFLFQADRRWAQEIACTTEQASLLYPIRANQYYFLMIIRIGAQESVCEKRKVVLS
jgi:hypothetical protein